MIKDDKNKTRTEIGIIGFGRFGQLIGSVLSKDFSVFVNDKKNLLVEGIETSNLEVVAGKDIVIVSVPISAFENTIKEISKYVKSDAIIIDVCSVKEHPVNIMQKELPASVSILATHPMFGPDSASSSNNGLKERKIVLCPVRIDNIRLNLISDYLISLGLNIIKMTPKEHDLKIAKSQLLTHFIGRGLLDLESETTGIDTEGYKRLLHILGVVKNDTWELFEDMNKYNSHAKKVRDDFLNSINNVRGKVEK